MIPIPPNSPQSLSAFFSGELWEKWQKKGWVFEIEDLPKHVTYIRNKPESCRLFVKGLKDGSSYTPPSGINLRIFGNLESAKDYHQKILTKNLGTNSVGDSSFLDEESFTVGVPFPGDEEIPQLRRIFEPSRFRRLLEPMLGEISYDDWRLQRSLTRHSLIAYKPGRRCVLKTKVKLRNLNEDKKIRKLLHLKVENRKTISQSLELALAISNATKNCQFFKTPRFVGTSPAMNIFGHEWIEGHHLDFSGPNAGDFPQKIALALNELHQIPLETSTHPPPQIMANEIDNLVSDLSNLRPQSRFNLLSLSNRLKNHVQCLNLVPSVLAHGDLHRLQILQDGDQIIFLDFDRAGRGFACMDLGSLMEDLILAGESEDVAQALLEQYQKCAPRKISKEELILGRCLARLRRSFDPFRSFSETWPDELEKSIEWCNSLLRTVERNG